MNPAARNAIVEANIGLVWFHLRNKITYNRGWIDGDDLLQEGALGLMRAVERHDPARGRLATIAGYWIRAYAQQALADACYACHVPRAAWYPKPPIGAVDVDLKDIADPAGDRADLEEMWAAVDQLREPDRSVLRLRYDEGLQAREVAARLGLPRTTTEWYERRALAALRRRLAG